jgi:hypothetical protein
MVTARGYSQFLAAIDDAEKCRSDPAFAAAWEEGQTMMLDEAVEYALGEREG